MRVTGSSAGWRAARGFTLIEVLLVLAIVGIVTAVTVPTFVKSIRGNRLQAGARAVVMAGKYCRSMAVLQQKPFVLRLDLAPEEERQPQLQLRVAAVARAQPDGEAVGDAALLAAGRAVDAAGAGSSEVSGEAGSRPEPTTVPSRGQVELERKVEMVRIVRAEVAGVEILSGTAEVVYEPNGRCAPYLVEITDRFGDTVRVTVDALSASVTERL